MIPGSMYGKYGEGYFRIALTHPAKRLGEAMARLLPMLRQHTRLVVSKTVKGKRKPLDLYELTWGSEEELTAVARPAVFAAPRPASIALLVEYAGREVEVDESSPSLTLGRGMQNNFTVRVSTASRRHARVELRGGRFMLADQSTNGCYVTLDGGESFFLHHDEHELQGSGHIGLGQELASGDNGAVRFRLAR